MAELVNRSPSTAKFALSDVPLISPASVSIVILVGDISPISVLRPAENNCKE